MGTEIKRNKKGQSQLNSSITDELLHDKRWISAEEAKLIIIYRAYYDFCIRVIEIDGNFPADFKGVSEDGHIVYFGGDKNGSKFISSVYDNNLPDAVILEKCKEIMQKHKMP